MPPQISTSTRSTCRTPSRRATFCSISVSGWTVTTDWSRRPVPSRALGIAYNIKKTGTVLRVAYARTFETPFNENLLLSSATGRRRSGAERFWLRRRVPIPAGLPQPVQQRVPAGDRQIPADRRRLLLEVHAQRVRLQHAAELRPSRSRSRGTTRSWTESPAA